MILYPEKLQKWIQRKFQVCALTTKRFSFLSAVNSCHFKMFLFHVQIEPWESFLAQNLLVIALPYLSLRSFPSSVKNQRNLFWLTCLPNSGWNSLAIIKHWRDQEGKKKGLYEVRLKGFERNQWRAFGVGPSVIAITMVLYSSSTT